MFSFFVFEWFRSHSHTILQKSWSYEAEANKKQN